jgi:hypothetical protein
VIFLEERGREYFFLLNIIIINHEPTCSKMREHLGYGDWYEIVKLQGEG